MPSPDRSDATPAPTASSRRTAAALKQDFIELLRIPTANEKKIDTYLQSRLIGLGHGVHCSRCGGSGNYSFNAVDGTRCFGCSGSGYVAQKLTGELYTQVQAEVREGRLEKYLAELRARQEVKQQAANAHDRVMAAWKAATDQYPYKWQDAAAGKQPAKDMFDQFNKPMSDAYKKVAELSSELHSLPYARKHAKTAEDSAKLDEKIAQTRTELLAAADHALKVIEEALARAPAIIAKHSATKQSEPDDGPSP